MTVQMTLTEDEAKVIADIRRVKAEKERKIEYSLKLLELASEYAQFTGDSYETFCNAYGHVDANEISCAATRESIIELIAVARREAGLHESELE